MIASDPIKYAIAFGIQLITAVIVVVSGSRRIPSERGSASDPALEEAGTMEVPPAERRPRIFTGEPIHPEPHRPATRRAARLVGGVAVLAAAGALAIIAFVRALVLMIQKIGD